ncbi:MAG: ribosome assembly RNA-binding protein YhbY [Clostridia bacterium]|nr:ribosome assembly RNA-binding protein YhbY [Clostridia bacterium]
MLTSKQRAALRAMANGLQPIMQVGKGGIGENLIKTVSDALEANELIKMKVLENSAESARSAAEELANATESEVVCVVGTKFVLYKQSSKEKNRKILLD